MKPRHFAVPVDAHLACIVTAKAQALTLAISRDDPLVPLAVSEDE